MNINNYLKVLIAIAASILFTNAPLRAYDKEGSVKIVKVSGEIASINVRSGKLQLEEDMSRDRKDPVEYKINHNDTRVVDPEDKKFLRLEDLREGQQVTVEFKYTQGELGMIPIAQKIIAGPMPVSREVSGELKAINAQLGTFALEEKPGRGDLLYFIYEPKDIIVMQSPSMEPVRLTLKPGDLIRVEFIMREGRMSARSITLLSTAPESVGTTTTTTTSTTVAR